MKDDWRLISVYPDELLEDVENDCEDEEGAKSGENEDGFGGISGEIGQWPSNISEETHSERREVGETAKGVAHRY